MFNSLFRSTNKKIAISIGIISASIYSCSVPLKNNEIMYNVWDTCEYDSNNEDVRYKYKECPRILNTGFKIPYFNTVKISNHGIFEISNEAIIIKLEIINPSKLFFKKCKKTYCLSEVFSYAESNIETKKEKMDEKNINSEITDKCIAITNDFIAKKIAQKNIEFTTAAFITITFLPLVLPFIIFSSLMNYDNGKKINENENDDFKEKNLNELIEILNEDKNLKSFTNSLGLKLMFRKRYDPYESTIYY